MESHVFRDFDEFATSIRGVESKMLLRNPNRRVWTIDAVDINGLHFQVGRLGSGNIARGQLQSDGFMLYLPLTPGIQYTANGTAMQMNSCAILEPGCEFCISTKTEHDWCTMFIPIPWFNRGDEASDSFLNSVKHTCRLTALDPQTANQFRAVIQKIIDVASTQREFESKPVATNVANNLFNVASGFLGIQSPQDLNRDGRPRVSRQQIIQSAMEFVEQREDRRFTIAELTTAVNVSERTLRTAFHEFFGVGPTRFLMLQQLHKIRHALKEADRDETTVGDVLLNHGELDFGRFASRYKKQFGELPSETLRLN